ncbi:MAG: DUF1552 domain-containing protein [Myxococcota bacterium]|nr:DUF1552 domain-containing protein [Myxococcota bacterium]
MTDHRPIRRPLARRSFLRRLGLVGAGLALGAPRFVRTAHADDDGTPRRVIYLGSSSGCVPDQWFPTSDTRFAYSTEPLERHAANLSIFRGVSMTNGGDHKPWVMATGSRESGSPSFDQLVAARMRELGYDQAPLVLCGEAKSGNHRGWLSFGLDGAHVLPERDPLRAFATVFGREPSAGGPTTPPGPDPRVAVNRAILGAVAGDLAQVRDRLSAAHRARVLEHADAVDRLAATFVDGGGVVSGACGEGEDAFLTAPSSYLERCKRHMDLIALAFACDRRRVASFLMTPLGHDNMRPGHYRGDAYLGGALGLPGLREEDQLDSDLPGDLHQSVAHHWASNARYATAFARIHRAEAAVVAYLIDRLKAIPEGSGSVFDHTAIFWTNEHADPNHGVNAGRARFPTVVIAGSRTGLRTGSFVDLPGGNEIHGRMLLSIARASGAELTRFGTHVEPWPELFA